MLPNRTIPLSQVLSPVSNDNQTDGSPSKQDPGQGVQIGNTQKEPQSTPDDSWQEPLEDRRHRSGQSSNGDWELISPPGGGYCLDGSLPAYYLRKGRGSGSKSWIFYLQGGGWCFSWRQCQYRAKTGLGTSLNLPQPRTSDSAWEDSLSNGGDSESESTVSDARGPPWGGGGLLSANKTVNPAFYNWNVAIVMYCDGGAHLGTRGAAFERGGTLVFDGIKGLRQIMDHLKSSQGMENAENVLVSGCSAGGHTVGVLCDFIGGQLNPRTKTKCLMDAGFFLDFPDSKGKRFIRGQMKSLHELQRAGVFLPPECLNLYPTKPWRCLFPENTIPFIKTPLLIVNNLHDYVAVNMIYHHQGARHVVPGHDIMNCIKTGEGCSEDDRQAYKDYGAQMKLKIETTLRKKLARGSDWFLIEDAEHCQVTNEGWLTKVIDGRTLRHAVVSWFFRATPSSSSPSEDLPQQTPASAPSSNSSAPISSGQVSSQTSEVGASNPGPVNPTSDTGTPTSSPPPPDTPKLSSETSPSDRKPLEKGGVLNPFSDSLTLSAPPQRTIQRVLLAASFSILGFVLLV